MAVVSELIDVGLTLKQQGKLKGAIEHFRQLHATFPQNARIKFELAVCWSAFDVPEQALPLYRELLALPKGKSLPAKDLPRLHTWLGATLYALQEYEQALSILNEGLRLYPTYRPLRVYRIFALQASEMPGSALNDALELMLESLAPSRWDTFEDQIRQIVAGMRATRDEAAMNADANVVNEANVANVANVADVVNEANVANVANVANETPDEPNAKNKHPQTMAQPSDELQSRPRKPDYAASALSADDEAAAVISPGAQSAEFIAQNSITIDAAEPVEEEIELNVQVVKKQGKMHKRKRARGRRGQLGKQSVRINISDANDNSKATSEAASKAVSKDSAPAAASGKIKIPLDSD